MGTKKNSMWSKGKPRPQAWWLSQPKDFKPKQFKKAENPATKNAAYSKIYNVIVGGYSLGLTFDLSEAKSWMKHASGTPDKFLIPVRYSVPR